MVFLKCKDCDNVMLEMGNPQSLCKEGRLEQLKPNTTDASTEKHVPVVTIENGLVVVRIGSEQHPMSEEHHIQWVFIQTSGGGTFYNLAPNDVPEAIFPMSPDEVEGVYVYCNLHGLWKAEEPVFPGIFGENPLICSAEFSDGCIDALLL